MPGMTSPGYRPPSSPAPTRVVRSYNPDGTPVYGTQAPRPLPWEDHTRPVPAGQAPNTNRQAPAPYNPPPPGSLDGIERTLQSPRRSGDGGSGGGYDPTPSGNIPSLPLPAEPQPPLGTPGNPYPIDPRAEADAQRQHELSRDRLVREGNVEDRTFQSRESAAEREARLLSEREGRGWEAGESAAERAARAAEGEASRGWQSTEAEAARRGDLGILNERARLSDSTFNSRLAALTAGGPGGGGDPGGGGGGGGYDPSVGQAARDGAFARAKDKQGKIARSSLDSLSAVMSNRGLLGSGMEGELAGNVISGSAGNLADFSTDQLMEELDQIGKVDERNFSAGERQKDRNASYKQSLLGLMNATLY